MIFSKPTERQGSHSPAKDNNIGPGTYDNGKKFGDGVKSFTIGEKPRERQADPSRGPGQYEPNDSPTRYRVPDVKFAPPS